MPQNSVLNFNGIRSLPDIEDEAVAGQKYRPVLAGVVLSSSESGAALVPRLKIAMVCTLPNCNMEDERDAFGDLCPLKEGLLFRGSSVSLCKEPLALTNGLRLWRMIESPAQGPWILASCLVVCCSRGDLSSFFQ